MGDMQQSGGGHPAMDYSEHNRTYDAFLRFSTLGTIWVLVIVVGLAIGATGHRWGLGSLMIVLGTAATGLGIASRGLGWKPVGGVFVLSLVIWLLTAH
jgi:Bacterial aa3 type cytochrome c oxidase subunit IV